MADIQARREARMRRIMESPEDRMKRLLGRSYRSENSPNTGTDRETSDNRGSAEDTVSSTTDGHDNKLKEPAVEDGLELRQRRFPETGDGNSVVKSTVKLSPLRKDLPGSASPSHMSDPNESLNASRNSKDAKMMLKHFEFLRIVLCFLVAFVCRKVLSTGYGIFYVESIFLPFLCLEIGFFLFKHHVLHNVMLPHRSSMMIGLLMLCGIRADILQTYNKIMGYTTAASEDFAMYLFAFMMSNMVAS